MDEIFENIIKKTAKLYNRFGIKSITMDDVASENMISKKTLYKYVKDKYELIEKTIDYQISFYHRELQITIEKQENAIDEMFELEKILNNMIKNHNPAVEFDLKKYYPDIFMKLSEVKAKKVFDIVKNNIEKGKQQGLYYKDINSNIIAKMKVVFQLQRIENKTVSYVDFANETALREGFKYHLRAVCNSKGLKYLNDKLKLNK